MTDYVKLLSAYFLNLTQKNSCLPVPFSSFPHTTKWRHLKSSRLHTTAMSIEKNSHDVFPVNNKHADSDK